MQEIKNVLIQIHNELMKISVKGDDTIALANCLQALRQLVNNQTRDEGEENYGYSE